jgi:tripartite-type tricarboxylate transporter receptor subunit TctC
MADRPTTPNAWPSRGITRRASLAAGALLAGAPCRAQPADGEPWRPARPVAFVIGFAPGSTIDFLARLVAREMATQLGQPVVVEARPGGSGNIATQSVLRAPADGQTILFAAITHGTNPALMNVGYDPRADLQMVAQMSAVPVAILVAKHTPWRTLADLVADAKARPEQVTFGHGGHGTSGFLASQLFSREAGFRYLPVPYSGSAPVYAAMLAGTVDGTFTPVDASLPGQVASGNMRALAVMQERRIALLPDVPTTREQGFGPAVDFRSWHGVMVRAGTPAPVLQALYRAVAAAINDPQVRDGMARAGIEPALSESPAAAQAFYLAEMDRWAALIQAIGLKPS